MRPGSEPLPPEHGVNPRVPLGLVSHLGPVRRDVSGFTCIAPKIMKLTLVSYSMGTVRVNDKLIKSSIYVLIVMTHKCPKTGEWSTHGEWVVIDFTLPMMCNYILLWAYSNMYFYSFAEGRRQHKIDTFNFVRVCSYKYNNQNPTHVNLALFI